MYRNPQNGLFTTANGMNLTKSRNNPNSRYNRVINYLRNHLTGEATKREMLENIFGLTVGQYPHGVSRGWGSSFWSLMVANGDLKMTRKGNNVFYSIPK